MEDPADLTDQQIDQLDWTDVYTVTIPQPLPDPTTLSTQYPDIDWQHLISVLDAAIDVHADPDHWLQWQQAAPDASWLTLLVNATGWLLVFDGETLILGYYVGVRDP